MKSNSAVNIVDTLKVVVSSFIISDLSHEECSENFKGLSLLVLLWVHLVSLLIRDFSLDILGQH